MTIIRSAARSPIWTIACLSLAAAPGLAATSGGTINAFQKISETEGGFVGDLDPGDQFGGAVATFGDLDGDGVQDLAVGALLDDDGGSNRGAVWMLFLNDDGTVKTFQKISDTEGSFLGVLDNSDQFGAGVANLGDLDGDGNEDVAVGATNDDDGGSNRGAVWVLFLDADGTVKTFQKISDTEGNFGGVLNDEDSFGAAVANLGDLDGDGVEDLAVGAPADGDGGFNHGAVWVLFLNANGTVKDSQKISDTAGGFLGVLDFGDNFGHNLASLGDLDGDGVEDVVVGAPLDDDGGSNHGAAWVLFLNDDGTVKGFQKISDTAGGFLGILNDGDLFGGFGLANLGDLDGDGVQDLTAGASGDDDGGSQRGAVWVLFLNDDGTVKTFQKISDTEGNFSGVLDDDDQLGDGVAALGDLDGDGVADLAVGARFDDDGGPDRGAVWVLFLQSNDFDDDGVLNVDDNCPLIANPNQLDNDNDSAGDVCDADDDNDGFNDDVDNCQFDANDQTDTDGDGAGDACDTDDDNDGVLDAGDACMATPQGEVVDGTGCSIAQQCPCDNVWKNHGAYVSCVAHASNDFVDLGLITEAERDAIVSAAGQSSCGKKK